MTLQPDLFDALPASALLESIPSLLLVFDPAGRLALANESARAALGLEGAEPLVAPLEGQLVPAVRAVVASGVAVRIEQTPVAVGGAERVFGFSASPVRLGGEVAAVLVTGKDLTDHVSLSRELRELEQAAHLEKVVRTVSHELRNPLNAIRGYAQYAALQLPPAATALASVQVIVGEVDRMDRILAGLRDLTGAGHLELTVADPESCLRDAVRAALPLYAAKGVEPALRVEGPLPRLLLDPVRLHQVILNLLKNALEAVGFGGSVVVSAGARDDGGLWLEVADNGPGVDAELGDRIFDLFVTTKAESGEGIGLSVCHEIVRAHDGSIRWTSPPGAGATFRVELPCR